MTPQEKANELVYRSAVEWLVDQLKEYDFADIKDQENYIIKIQSWVLTEKIEQAKAMEKKQIMDIDYRLSVIEDYAKGEAGDEITKLRKYIDETYGK